MVDSTNLPDVDINQIATDLNGKMDRDGINATASVCVESWHEGTEWYRVYSDGWCEQGGIAFVGTSPYTVSLSKPYKDGSYNIVATGCSDENVQIGIYAHGSETATQFKLMASYSSIYIYWSTRGYIR